MKSLLLLLGCSFLLYGCSEDLCEAPVPIMLQADYLMGEGRFIIYIDETYSLEEVIEDFNSKYQQFQVTKILADTNIKTMLGRGDFSKSDFKKFSKGKK